VLQDQSLASLLCAFQLFELPFLGLVVCARLVGAVGCKGCVELSGFTRSVVIYRIGSGPSGKRCIARGSTGGVGGAKTSAEKRSCGVLAVWG
jgi:hypothetical protein